jgi:hypothetical protein
LEYYRRFWEESFDRLDEYLRTVQAEKHHVEKHNGTKHIGDKQNDKEKKHAGDKRKKQ